MRANRKLMNNPIPGYTSLSKNISFLLNKVIGIKNIFVISANPAADI